MSLSEHNQACRRQRAGSVLLLAAAALCVLLNQCESLSRIGKKRNVSAYISGTKYSLLISSLVSLFKVRLITRV